MENTYRLRIEAITETTPSARVITFGIPEKMQEAFRYDPGQYLTLTMPGNENVRRCYSICSVPGEDGLRIGVKKVPGGVMSSYLVDEAVVGQTVDIKVPEGNFRLSVNPLRARQYVFVAGGSGITPIRSMIGHILEGEPLSKATLIYGNRDEENIIFKDYFSGLTANDRFTLINCLQYPPSGWTGETGLLTHEKIYALIQGLPLRYDTAEYYICGPKPMMDNAKQAFAGLGVPASQVNAEYFQADVALSSVQTGQSRGVVLLLPGGKRETIEVKPNQSILDGALAGGVDLPYSCKQGVCSSCKMKLLGGKIEQTVDLALSDKDKKEGYILTCCAYPMSGDVSVDCRDIPSNTGSKRRGNRRLALMAGFFFGMLLLGAMTFPAPTNMISPGPMNTGHETLSCEDCHSLAKGTLAQQLQANFQHLIGNRAQAVTFGSNNVDNKKCESCHKRPTDRHPMHRFKEPRFKDARQAIGVERCESCHSEHQGVRLTVTDLTFCSHCHQDTELTDDPLDISHAELIHSNQWVTCLQCHDFHGNHVTEVAHLMKDTIPVTSIIDYANGGQDPYGDVKTHSVEAIGEAIKKMRK